MGIGVIGSSGRWEDNSPLGQSGRLAAQAKKITEAKELSKSNALNKLIIEGATTTLAGKTQPMSTLNPEEKSSLQPLLDEKVKVEAGDQSSFGGGKSEGLAPQMHTSGGSITEAYKTYDPRGASIEQERINQQTPFAKGFIPRTESGKEPAKDAMGASMKGETPNLHSEFHSFAEQKIEEMMSNAFGSNPVDTAKKSGFNTGVNTNWMSGY